MISIKPYYEKSLYGLRQQHELYQAKEMSKLIIFIAATSKLKLSQ